MRVALIDNMNNNFFSLTRYFRDLGVDADLFLIPDRKIVHFDPQNDTWKDLSNKSWIKKFPLSYHWTTYFKSNLEIIKETFKEYDKLIVCGPAMGLINKAGLNVDLFIPYGADLFQIPFPRENKIDNTLKNFILNAFTTLILAPLQIKSIKSAKKIICNTNWKTAKNALDKLDCRGINLPRIMVYKEKIPAEFKKKYKWIKSHDFVIFSPTRHLWKTNADPMPDFIKEGGAKRNDKLIKAFKRFVDLKKKSNPLLLLCEYGADVNHSKKLISDLDLNTYVRWLPLLPRKEIVAIMTQSHCIADQFRVGHSATSAGTTNEALAYGVPVITNSDGAIFIKKDPYFKCPIIQALTENEIYSHLVTLFENPKLCIKIAKNQKKWFKENLSLNLAKKYIDLIANVT